MLSTPKEFDTLSLEEGKSKVLVQDVKKDSDVVFSKIVRRKMVVRQVLLNRYGLLRNPKGWYEE